MKRIAIPKTKMQRSKIIQEHSKLLVGGLEYLDYDFPIIHWEWNVIIPTDDTMLQVP